MRDRLWQVIIGRRDEFFVRSGFSSKISPRHPVRMGARSLIAVSCLLLTCLCAACGLATSAATSTPPAAATPPAASAAAPAGPAAVPRPAAADSAPSLTTRASPAPGPSEPAQPTRPGTSTPGTAPGARREAFTCAARLHAPQDFTIDRHSRLPPEV